jgi:hypothetical protein
MHVADATMRGRLERIVRRRPAVPQTMRLLSPETIPVRISPCGLVDDAIYAMPAETAKRAELGR